MDERRKQLMYDDVVYNLSFLLTAVYFDDHKIFDDYSIWIYELLCNLMKDLDRDRIMQQMVHHYEIMAEIIENDLFGFFLPFLYVVIINSSPTIDGMKFPS